MVSRIYGAAIESYEFVIFIWKIYYFAQIFGAIALYSNRFYIVQWSRVAFELETIDITGQVVKSIEIVLLEVVKLKAFDKLTI